MRAEITVGQVRIQSKAGRGLHQWRADVMLNGAARPRTLIVRVVLDDSHGWGNKGGRMRGGWHFARCIGARRLCALAYATDGGLPSSTAQLQAPAYAWWPQHRRVPASASKPKRKDANGTFPTERSTRQP